MTLLMIMYLIWVEYALYVKHIIKYYIDFDFAFYRCLVIFIVKIYFYYKIIINQ